MSKICNYYILIVSILDKVSPNVSNTRTTSYKPNQYTTITVYRSSVSMLTAGYPQVAISGQGGSPAWSGHRQPPRPHAANANRMYTTWLSRSCDAVSTLRDLVSRYRDRIYRSSEMMIRNIRLMCTKINQLNVHRSPLLWI